MDLTGTTAVERSVVHTVNLIDQLSLKYKIGQHNIGLKGYVSWSSISSDRENFTNMNVADFNYGLTALLQLPWKLQFSTDLTMYSRRGYESSSMNTNDLVWNVRSSVRVKQMAKHHLADPSLSCALLGMNAEGLMGDLNTLGFLFEALCEHDLRIYAEVFGGKLFHYQDYQEKEIDAVVEAPNGEWGAFEIKLGANQIDAAPSRARRV